jgi:hypothetical protein
MVDNGVESTIPDLIWKTFYVRYKNKSNNAYMQGIPRFLSYHVHSFQVIFLCPSHETMRFLILKNMLIPDIMRCIWSSHNVIIIWEVILINMAPANVEMKISYLFSCKSVFYCIQITYILANVGYDI